MSYILEALRKVERQRRARTVPDLATVHSPSGARRVWVPVILAALLVNAGFLTLLLWYRPWASSGPPPPLAQAPAADATGTPPAISGASAPAPPVVASVPALTPAPPLTPTPSPGATSSGSGSTAGVDSPAQQSSAAVPEVPVSSAPRVRITVPVSPGDATARDAAAPEPSGTPERPVADPGSSSRPAPGPAEPAPSPRVTPQPVEPAPRGAVRTAIPADLPAPFRAAVSQLRLEALVYADNPKDRKVFISGRRYVEGDKLDSGIVVERIVEEGVVLSYAGQRHVLRHFR
ncbi:MAG: general secretion pathway protein GspB [Candidatus Rokuibacteriota bacterium]